MVTSKKEQIRELLKSIETGDPGPVAVVNEAKYIQHNPQTQEGSEGLAALFKRLSETSPRVNVVRAFEDGEFVFGHTEYDFANRKIGFEVFRFEDGRAVEHWDNIQERQDTNTAGLGMVDGSTQVEDFELTEQNRAFIRSFMETVFVGGHYGRLGEFIDESRFADHNPSLGWSADALRSALKAEDNGHRQIDYQRIHRVLAEGNFVLCVSEGNFGDQHCAFYDLLRVSDGKIVEHWDTIEKIAPRSEWKNSNGKF
jgi:predicted SnoaL-like aldol condensation-catalyzing enzyme